ncbi:MAG: hypothetical protein H7070_14055 [Saprospiraceae bacterium]|nr:hypothetical protein [Pyrinomonadaceae bacterium]
MKTTYQVKVTVKMGEVESDCYADTHVEDDGVKNDLTREVRFETVADFIEYRINNPEEFTA